MENIRYAERCADQGDIRYMRVGSLPKGATPADLHDGGRAMIARSDAGHHHVVESGGAIRYYTTSDPLTSYVELEADGVLRHLKSGPDGHAPHGLRAGRWMFRRQHEVTPEGLRAVED